MAGEAATVPEFDPRFDPRFQRGYDPAQDATGPEAVPGSESGPEAVAAPDATIDGRTGTGGTGTVTSSSARGSAAARREPEVEPELERASPTAPAERSPVPVRAADAVSDGGPPVDPTVRDAVGYSVPPAEPFEDTRRDVARLWRGAAWALAVGAIVAGCALFWTSVTGPAFYGGPTSFDDRLLQSAAWMLAPPLVEAGVVGVIALLVVGAIRRARAGAGGSAQ